MSRPSPPRKPQPGALCGAYCTQWPEQYHCRSCHSRTNHTAVELEDIVVNFFKWKHVVDDIDAVKGHYGLDRLTDIQNLIDFKLSMPFPVKCPKCMKGTLQLHAQCTALLPLDPKRGAVRYREKPPAALWAVRILPPPFQWRCWTKPIRGIRRRLLSVLSDIKSLSLGTLNLLDNMWSEVEEDPTIAAISDDDLRLLPCTVASPTTLSFKQTQDIGSMFRQCELDAVSGCWRFPIGDTATHATTQYTHVMRAKESYGLHLPAAEQALFIYAHADLPDLVDTVEPVEGDDRLVRHHPLRCELFHQGDDHGRCIRPSHLAWGDNEYKKSNQADQLTRKRITALLLRRLRAAAAAADTCYSKTRA